jgi:hypothetical protein
MPPFPSCFWQWSVGVLLLFLVMMPGRVKEEGRHPTPCHNAATRGWVRIELKGRCLAPSYSTSAAAPIEATHQPQ